MRHVRAMCCYAAFFWNKFYNMLISNDSICNCRRWLNHPWQSKNIMKYFRWKFAILIQRQEERRTNMIVSEVISTNWILVRFKISGQTAPAFVVPLNVIFRDFWLLRRTRKGCAFFICFFQPQKFPNGLLSAAFLTFFVCWLLLITVPKNGSEIIGVYLKLSPYLSILSICQSTMFSSVSSKRGYWSFAVTVPSACMNGTSSGGADIA